MHGQTRCRGLGDPHRGEGLDFGAEVEEISTALRELLTSLRAGGSTIAAYGAAAKGSTLVNRGCMFVRGSRLFHLAYTIDPAIEELERPQLRAILDAVEYAP